MKPYVWKCTADKFLRENYAEHGGQYVADALGIDKRQVWNRAYFLGIKSSAVKGRPFTSDDPRRAEPYRFVKGDPRINRLGTIKRKQRVEIK